MSYIIVTATGIWVFDNIDDAQTFYCEDIEIGYVYTYGRQA